ncbi:ribonuclease R [Sinomicrobium weinanense]|uniref:Ribonuclease R n=1 Tax=Sinomicrobium weinanense TaxID=2842200 RepID=A0A926Q4U8_9FLAO|nr:ribonuclease R [Sinomicrobium weinanense]MBC9797275.1 ribonuclease R [Sinomicrobium weinanense]MBU3125408.1 ribonuclease R [Sinomicrobium weinanense]
MSRKKKRTEKQKKSEITKGIFSVLEKDPKSSFNYKQIASKLGITDTNGRNLLIKRLGELKQKKKIEEVERGRYRVIPSLNYFTGTVDITGRGNAYVICDDLDNDVFVPSNLLNKALHGDEVEVYVFPRRRRNGKKLEGEVTRVISRKKTAFVGIVQMQKNFAFVLPTDFRMYTDIFVAKNKINDAENGDKVLVEITEWPDKADSPYGRIVEVFGKPGEHDTEIHAILAEYGLPYTFPEEVEHFANQLDTSITPEEIKKRRDMRDVLTFTIDPKDAKDFDDALSFRVLDNGNYEVGIHIADVSHYVVPGSMLDEEAYNRATSVYLVDRVVPMLPEILSNNACSLRPNEEKYTFSAVFEINEKAEVLKQWFGRTVTYSDRRFAYEEAQAMLESESNEVPKEVSLTGKAYKVEQEVADAVLILNKLAKIMRTKRMSMGAISFDKVEVKFNLDEAYVPTGVYFKEAKDANKLIEEFMLLANRKVAEFIGRKKPEKTFVYRVHDDPDEEKLMQLQGVISKFGYSLDMKSKKTITSSLNSLLEEVQGRKEQNLVDTLAIRTMSKAEYTTHNIGHYGLAFDYYTHFTSPIRRYPDVMVHRLLQQYLDGGDSAKEEEYEERCRHSSNMENLAVNAERSSIKYMQIKFMEDRRDQEFVGVISGVTEWGIYVEIIENKCEGMIRIRDIRDDYYVFDEKQYALVGEVTKNMYQLGDEVVVKVKSTDPIKRHLDFELLGKAEE